VVVSEEGGYNARERRYLGSRGVQIQILVEFKSGNRLYDRVAAVSGERPWGRESPEFSGDSQAKTRHRDSRTNADTPAIHFVEYLQQSESGGEAI
jgi:hypothetical protein